MEWKKVQRTVEKGEEPVDSSVIVHVEWIVDGHASRHSIDETKRQKEPLSPVMAGYRSETTDENVVDKHGSFDGQRSYPATFHLQRDIDDR